MVAALPLFQLHVDRDNKKREKNPKQHRYQTSMITKTPPKQQATENKDKTRRKPRVQNQTNALPISLVAAALSKKALRQLDLDLAGSHRGTSPFQEEKQQAAGRGNSDSMPSHFHWALLAGWGDHVGWALALSLV